MLRTLLGALLTLAAAHVASAQTADLDSLARTFMAERQPAGLVIGTVTGDDTQIRRYGVASLTDSSRLRPGMRFEIGSVTKVFVSLLLADTVQRGAVTLDTPIGALLPDSVETPVVKGRPIALHHLATHTAGLPRLPFNLRPADPANPYAGYTAAKLHAFLDAAELSAPPGSTYAYSNVGGGLLGHLLARQADSTFAGLLDQRILTPLGLDDTVVPSPSDTTGARLATGHTAGGGSAPYWTFDALAGTGALRAPARDVLRFLRVHLRPDTSSLFAAVRMTHEVRHERSARASVALGWNVTSASDGSRLYWHNGGTGGFRSFAAFHPDSTTALVVLVNQALPLRAFNRFAFRLMRVLHRGDA
jgi:CubicO group peptidase (beta-lactamase class C family)